MTVPDVVRCNTRDRTTWAAVAWVVVGLLASLGVLFLVNGIDAAATSKAYIVVRTIPGGMHAHGGVLLGLAVSIAAGLVPPVARKPYRHHYVRAVLVVTCAYQVWIATALFLARDITGVNTTSGVLWWLASLALSIVLIVRSPRPDGEDAPCSARQPS